jgi:3-hydroxyisobutyrate dehydrogenase-like beta-hydroxyacid dehydrogenase
MKVVSEALGVASATKMCRSVIIKGMEALVAESLLAARHYGVEDAVLESLDNLFPRPDWPEHARYLISRSLMHGTRRADEMREAAKTVREAGLIPWMSEGSVERHAWAPQFDSALNEESLEGILDAIHTQFSNNLN